MPAIQTPKCQYTFTQCQKIKIEKIPHPNYPRLANPLHNIHRPHLRILPKPQNYNITVHG